MKAKQIKQKQKQKTIGQFSLYFYSLSSFFPFDLPLPTSQLSIIRSGFLVPGPTGLHHVVHWGGVKNIKVEKCKRLG